MMAWSTPLTAVSNTALTAAQWNASVRDNLLTTAPALATTAGYHFASNGANVIAERAILDGVVETQETTTSTTFTNLATDGPGVTMTTGAKALVWMTCQLSNSGAASTAATFEITGATTNAAADTRSIVKDGGSGAGDRYGASTLMNTNAGSNTFHMVYRVSGGTGTYLRRRLVVMGL